MTVVDEVKSRLDILDLVSQYTSLQRSGRSYKAVCPFHVEKTPSFFVFPERQSWRCFGACATGGDVFSFLMRIENLDFSQALKRLAQQAGVNLAESRSRKGETDILYRINESACEFFRDLLTSPAGKSPRAYLQKRGLTGETIDKFQLGLSPGDGESLKSYLASKGHTREQMALAGVITESQERGYRDLFRRRLMFPIRDAEGQLAGFGGRTLDESHLSASLKTGPKYLNSPRSPIFDKGHILYALYLAKDAAREGSIVIVEGYMDAIVAHQHGFSNVVASMGTALTQQQASLVRRLLHRPGSQPMSKGQGEVILALDPDAAGQEATLRSLEASWGVFQARPVASTRGITLYQRVETPDLKVAPLPQGKDPDEVILESPEGWASLVKAAVPFMDYLFTTLPSRVDLNTPQGKTWLAQIIFRQIAAVPDPFQQDHYFQRLAHLLGVSEETLQASVGRPKPGRTQTVRTNSYRGRPMSPRQGPDAQSTGGGRWGQEAARDAVSATPGPFARLEHDPLEEYSLALILQNPQLLYPRQHSSPEDISFPSTGKGWEDSQEEQKATGGLRPDHFQRAENREVFTNWMKCSTLDTLEETLDEALKGHLKYLLAKALPPLDRKQREVAFIDCVRRLEERYLRGLKREEELRLSQATPEEIEGQGQEILSLNERLKHIYFKE